MSEKKSQEAKKGKPSSAGRRKDSINRYWAVRHDRNKERQARRVIRKATKLSGDKVIRRKIFKGGTSLLRNEEMAAKNVATSTLRSGEKKEDGLKRFNSVLLGISSTQRDRWDEARERRLAARKARKAAKRVEEAAVLFAEINAAAKAEKKPAKPKNQGQSA